MTLRIRVPQSGLREREYTLNVLLGEFLGLDFTLEVHEGSASTQICLGTSVLAMPDVFLGAADGNWLEASSRAGAATGYWPVAEDIPQARVLPEPLPVLFGVPGRPWFRREGASIELAADLLGSAFYLLSRYDEALPGPRDAHQRPGLESICALHAAHLDHPLVDEYVEVIWSCLSSLNAGLARRDRRFSILPSHDVDAPYRYLFRPWRRILRNVVGDAWRRKSPRGAARDLLSACATKRGEWSNDPFNCFDRLMASSEERGLTSTFFFLTGNDRGPMDGDYSIAHPALRHLISEANRRGHRIGLHGSYETAIDGARMHREMQVLQNVCADEGVRERALPSRQHFLRWKAPDTLRHLVDAGSCEDNSLGFAERPGFRCGTSHNYPAYDLTARRQLPLRLQPLILMECSVIDARYMGLGTGEAARALMVRLKDICRYFQGDFSVLWHNSRLVDGAEQALYLSVLDA